MKTNGNFYSPRVNPPQLKLKYPQNIAQMNSDSKLPSFLINQNFSSATNETMKR